MHTMKLFSLFSLIMLLSLFSCKKEEHKVQHSEMKPGTSELKNIHVVNELDPICQMKTSEYLKDTAHYQRKMYGFCSGYCKEKFKKDPKKYVP